MNSNIKIFMIIPVLLFMANVPPLCFGNQETALIPLGPPQEDHDRKQQDPDPKSKTEEHVITRIVIPLRAAPREARPEDFLQRITCEADVILIGYVRDKTGRLTKKGTGVYSDQVLEIEEILKHPSITQLAPSQRITFTRSGGTVLHNGRRVTTFNKEFYPFQVGKKYLLYLRHSSLPVDYEASWEGSFVLRDDGYNKLTHWPLWSASVRTISDVSEFLQLVRSSINSTCSVVDK